MKSMGGTDDDTNLVSLTSREHFIAHWLLWRIYRNRQTALAFFTFTNKMQSRNRKENSISSRAFSEAREAASRIKKEEMRGVLNSNRSKKVKQYSLDGNFIAIWPSAKEVERVLNTKHVSAVCRGERKTAGGFIWKYENEDLSEKTKYRPRKSNRVKNRTRVIQRDFSGRIVAEYSSICEAVKITKIPKSTIQLGIARGYANGFNWEKQQKAEI